MAKSNTTGRGPVKKTWRDQFGAPECSIADRRTSADESGPALGGAFDRLASAAVGAALSDVERLSREVCQSEIERAMLVAFVVYGLEDVGSVILRHAGNEYGPLGRDITALVIEPQARIGKYTADFVIREFDLCEGVYGQPCVVECDGHDFHSRTKRQAAHDRKRDREMQALGFMVLRFPGSTIWADPVGCAREVAETIRAAEKLR